MPVSHPQTRPNQSTGPHAAKHMLHQTGMHRAEDPPHHTAQKYTDTHPDEHSQEHAPPHTRAHTKRPKHTETPSGTTGMQAASSTRKHTDTITHMCTYPQHVPISSQPQTSAFSTALGQGCALGTRTAYTFPHAAWPLSAPSPRVVENPPTESGYRRIMSLGITLLCL